MRRLCVLALLLTLNPLTDNVYSYNLKQISDKEYMTNSSITSLCQDGRGLMWIGTCDGLNVYDGQRVFEYRISDGPDYLSGNLIDNMVNSSGRICWIQTYYGLNRLDMDTGEIVHFNQFQKLFFMTSDRDGNFFVLNDSNCVYHYDGREGVFVKITLTGVPVSDVLCFFVDRNNLMWVVMKGYAKCFRILQSEDGLSLLPEESRMAYTRPLERCYSDGEAISYIDAGHNLYSYSIQTGRTEKIAWLGSEIRKRGDVSSIVRHRDSYFVGFIMDGLIKVEKTGNGRYGISSMPINSGVFCMKKDNFQDIVWIGTDGQGVYLYSEPLYSIRSVELSRYEDDIQRPVRGIHVDEEKTLWVATKGNGIFRIFDYESDRSPAESRKSTLTASNSELGSNAVYCFAESSRPLLWIGEEEGLCCYSYTDRKVIKVPVYVDGLDFKYIHDIYETGDGELWMASVGMGVARAKISGPPDAPPVLTDVERYVINKGELGSNYFFSIYAESDSLVLFANKGYGAFRYNPATDGIEPLSDMKFDNMTLNSILDINRDSSGNWLLGTSYGLVKYDSDTTYTLFNSHNGFPNSTIHAIIKSGPDDFWLSTNLGLVNFDSKENSFRTYGYNDGLDVIEFSDGASFYDSADGTVYFGGINGFASISADGEQELPYMPPVYFDGLSIRGEKSNISEFLSTKGSGRSPMEVLNLDYDQNFFSVSFAAVDYINGNNYTYYYRLRESGEEWINNGHSREISFTGIAPGEYTLQVKYHNGVFDMDSGVYSLLVRIADPWYASWWAYILYSVLAAAVSVLVIRSEVLKHRARKQKMLDELEARHKEEIFESKLRFFTDVASEFSTPLTLIYGSCGQILADKSRSQLSADYVKLIQTNASRLDRLIHELVEFRHIETGNRAPRIERLDISAIIRDIAARFTDVAHNKGVSFDCTVPGKIEMNSDKAFINVVLINLTAYALQHTPAGQSVSLGISVMEDGGLVLSLSCTSSDIREDELRGLFNRYTALDSLGNTAGTAFSRSGLGLSIAWTMVRLLGGSLEADRSPAGSVEFTLSLPQQNPTPETEYAAWPDTVYLPEADSCPVALPKYEFDEMRPTVLVMDDEVEMLWFIGEIFSKEFNVMTLQSSSGLSPLLGEIYPNIIICDSDIPESGGIGVVRSVKASKDTAHIPVIIISGRYEAEQQIEALSAGAQLYVTKPFSPDFLKVSVLQMMKRKEVLKDYFSSPISSYEKTEGKLTHKESRKFLQKVLKVINDNITDRNLSPRFIADALAISTRSLYRRIQDAGADSLSELIRDSRLHVARNLLQTTRKTIEEIVFASGFTNKVTFFKAFREKYGCTPKEYRSRYLEMMHKSSTEEK